MDDWVRHGDVDALGTVANDEVLRDAMGAVNHALFLHAAANDAPLRPNLHVPPCRPAEATRLMDANSTLTLDDMDGLWALYMGSRGNEKYLRRLREVASDVDGTRAVTEARLAAFWLLSQPVPWQ